MQTEHNPVLDSDKKEPVPASRGMRFLNYVIDFIIIIILYVIVVVFMTYNGMIVEELTRWQSILLSWTIIVIYYTFFESIFARSPAKFLTRTRVTNAFGEKPGFTQILGRSLARLIPFEAFSFLGTGNWHDSASGTMVVND